MKAEYSDAVNEALENAPAAVRKAFFKQVGLLVRNLREINSYSGAQRLAVY